MKYDKINESLDKIEEISSSCLAAGILPSEYLEILNMRFQFPEGEADWLFIVYSLRFQYLRSLTGSEYWELQELREEMTLRFKPVDDLYQVARSKDLWIV